MNRQSERNFRMALVNFSMLLFLLVLLLLFLRYVSCIPSWLLSHWVAEDDLEPQPSRLYLLSVGLMKLSLCGARTWTQQKQNTANWAAATPLYCSFKLFFCMCAAVCFISRELSERVYNEPLIFPSCEPGLARDERNGVHIYTFKYTFILL